MKRVLFLCGDVGLIGGTVRVASLIASELSRKGYHVSILSCSHGLSAVFELDSGVQLYSLGMEGYSANLSDFRVWSRLRRFVREERIDLLIDVDVVLSWYSIPATLGTRTRVISWEHFHLFVNVGDLYQRCRRQLGRWLAVRYAYAVVTLTEKDRRQYLNNLKCRARVLAIPNPQTITHQLRATLESRVVLAAGRLVPQKGFDLLLHAWGQIAASLPPGWCLRIVGSGQDEAMLKALCGQLALVDSVEFVTNTADMASQYLDASIFALSSRFEGLPLVLLEAKSFGLPVVSFDCDCGPSDIVRDGKDGLLVEAGNVEAFASSLRQLIENEPLRIAMGQCSYEDHRFELHAVVDRWQVLFG